MQVACDRTKQHGTKERKDKGCRKVKKDQHRTKGEALGRSVSSSASALRIGAGVQRESCTTLGQTRTPKRYRRYRLCLGGTRARRNGARARCNLCIERRRNPTTANGLYVAQCFLVGYPSLGPLGRRNIAESIVFSGPGVKEHCRIGCVPPLRMWWELCQLGGRNVQGRTVVSCATCALQLITLGDT